MTNCPFCHLANDVEIIQESNLCVAFLDKYPVNPGHTLIIPKRHVASYFELTEEEILDMNRLLKIVQPIIEMRYQPDGFNIGINVGLMAGQSIFHVHLHLIPRYQGDVENPRGGVRSVIPARQNY